MFDVIIKEHKNVYMYDTIGFTNFYRIVSMYEATSKIEFSNNIYSTIRYFRPIGNNDYMIVLRNWDRLKGFPIRVKLV